METFGAIHVEQFEVPFVKGVAEKMVPSDKSDKYEVAGIVRKPIEDEEKSKWNLGFVKRFMNTMQYYLMSDEGLFRNMMVVIVYLIAVLAIPLLLYFAVVWSLMQINYIRSDIYESVYTIEDVFFSSSYDFWFDDLQLKELFYAMAALTFLFIIVGIVELI